MTIFGCGRGGITRVKTGGVVVNPPEVLGTPTLRDKTTPANPITDNYTLEAGADGLLVIVGDDTSGAPSAATWTATGASAQNMTQDIFDAGGVTGVRIFSLANPDFGSASGAGVISITTPTIPLWLVPISISGWSGVAPATNSQGEITSNTDPAALAIDPAPNSLIIHAVCNSETSASITWGVGETELIDESYAAASTGRAGVSFKQSVSGDATTVDLSFAANPVRYAEVVGAYPA